MDPATPKASQPPTTVVTVVTSAASVAAASTTRDEPPSSNPTPQNNPRKRRQVRFAHTTTPAAKRSHIDPSPGDTSPSIDRIVPSVSSSPPAPSGNTASGVTQGVHQLSEVPPNDSTTAVSTSAVGVAATSPTVLRSPPPLVHLNQIPANQLRIIKGTLSEMFNISTPRDFQLEAINHTCFEDDTVLIVYRRTADGKSLVPLGTAAIRRGIVIVLVPLIGLGSDQVEKAQFTDHNVEAYHIDEHKGADATKLRCRLEGLDDEEIEHVSCVLYFSPQGLKNWSSTLNKLAARGYISSFVIDEAHTVELCGRSFRPVFIEAVQMIPELIKLMPHPVPRILMSATFQKEERDKCVSLLGDMKPNILHGSLARRNTDFLCVISGSPARTLKTSGDRDLTEHDDKQQLWYCNSKTNAETSYLDSAVSLLEKHQKLGTCEGTCCESFTGDDGIMRKAFLMDAFTNFERDTEHEPDWYVKCGLG